MFPTSTGAMEALFLLDVVRNGLLAVKRKLTVDRGEAVLNVRDNGPGVEPAHLARIFERDYSSRPTHRSNEMVTEMHFMVTEMHFGIGLWLVRQHVLALGGSVVADNAPDGGLSVTVRIPCAPPSN